MSSPRDRIAKLPTAQLQTMLDIEQEDETLDAIYDELELRHRDAELHDWTEADYYSAQSERLEMYMGEE